MARDAASSPAADESGIALVMALGVLMVLTILSIGLYTYSTLNAHSARLSQERTSAWAVAEAGADTALSILYRPATSGSLSVLSEYLLPPGACGGPGVTCVSSGGSEYAKTVVPEGYALWNASLNCPIGGCDPTVTAPVWTITSTGYVRNPDGTTMASKVVQVKVAVVPVLDQPSPNPSWDYIMTTHPPTPGVCDETMNQSGNIYSPVYVTGNLCLGNTAVIAKGPLDVGGSLTLKNPQNGVGVYNSSTSTWSPLTTGVHIVGSCTYQQQATVANCDQPSLDNVWANPPVDKTLEPNVLPPVVDWGSWYLNATPGPYSPCVNPTGPVPVFDDNQGSFPDVTKMDDSLDTHGVPPFNLTPSTSYSCVTGGGRLSWDAPSRTLTVDGTFFIDGSAYVQNGAVNSYVGQGSLYLSGTFLEKNSSLCAKGTNCDPSTWNPNQTMLGIFANGSGGQVIAGDGAQFKSSHFQGAVLATNNIDVDTTSQVDGPMEASAINLGQSVSTTFPSITILPAGFPSSTLRYAEPLQPIYLTG